MIGLEDWWESWTCRMPDLASDA